MTKWHERLKRYGISHNKVAERTGYTRPYITAMLRGGERMQPKVEAACRDLLEEAYEATVSKTEALLAELTEMM